MWFAFFLVSVALYNYLLFLLLMYSLSLCNLAFVYQLYCFLWYNI